MKNQKSKEKREIGAYAAYQKRERSCGGTLRERPRGRQWDFEREAVRGKGGGGKSHLGLETRTEEEVKKK